MASTKTVNANERNTPHPGNWEMDKNAANVRQKATHHITIPDETFEAWIDVEDFGEKELKKLVKALARSVGVWFDGKTGEPAGTKAWKMPVVTDLREGEQS